MTTADGSEYRMIVCSCGKQNSAGICAHVKQPYFVHRNYPNAIAVPTTLVPAGFVVILERHEGLLP